MNRWRRWLSVLLAALMVFSSCSSLAEAAPVQAEAEGQLSIADLEALGATAYVHNDRVTFVDGACSDQPVQDMEDAARVVDSMLTLLGGDDRTELEPWRTITDASGNIYYLFQQVYARTTVCGGAVKVVTDAGGNMLGLIASLKSDLPEMEEAQGITAGLAETLVLEHMAEANMPEGELVEDSTDIIILPTILGVDIESEDESSRFVWAVYTTNPGGSQERSSELPYLAHYVTMDGEYLYSLPTILPGDEAGTSGSGAAYVFDFMEPADYTGAVKLSTGEEMEISIQLMRDSRTGMYYLGNLERRIAVADCWEFLYNDGRVVLEASRDNTGWDDTCLLSLYNYCRAWDFYSEIGWNGADGNGTPMLILKDFCNRDHEGIDNAAYAGRYNGWLTFLSSSVNDFSQCLDVLGHEFTHCVTHSVMTYNAYLNDFGAINEAMSDIQGNICEMMFGATEDASWQIAEKAARGAIRSMSDPHAFSQPDYTWDLHYRTNVKTPTQLNDRGGVHTNSSLLNNIAYRLYASGGMTLEEARAYWFAADCSMVPGTDYVQLSELLPWVLKTQGMDRYMTALEQALDATRLRTEDIPEVFDDDLALVSVTLPEKEHFEDGNWMLMILTVNVEEISNRIESIFGRKGEYADVLDGVAEILGIDPALLPTAEEIEKDPLHAWDRIGNEMNEEMNSRLNAISEENRARLTELIRKAFDGLISLSSGAAGQDGRTVRMISRPGVTVPILYRLEIDSEMKINSAGLAVYTFGSWHDVGAIINAIDLDALQEAMADQTADPADPEDTVSLNLDNLPDLGGVSLELPPEMLQQMMDVLGDVLYDLIFYNVKGGQANLIPSDGLEKVEKVDLEGFDLLQTMSNLESYADSAPAENESAEEANTGDVQGTL